MYICVSIYKYNDGHDNYSADGPESAQAFGRYGGEAPGRDIKGAVENIVATWLNKKANEQRRNR